MDYAAVPTPPACYVDFCLIPMGTGSASVADEVAAVQRLVRASGLAHTMHAAGTTVGPWPRSRPPMASPAPSPDGVPGPVPRWRPRPRPPIPPPESRRRADGPPPEGSWDDVMALVGKAHSVVHARGVVRVQSSLRAGTRTDKTQTAADKVRRVEELLAREA